MHDLQEQLTYVTADHEDDVLRNEQQHRRFEEEVARAAMNAGVSEALGAISEDRSTRASPRTSQDEQCMYGCMYVSICVLTSDCTVIFCA